MLWRFLLYGLGGWCVEITFTALYEAIAGTRKDPADPRRRLPLGRAERARLAGHTYLWMLPLYGATGLGFERLHDAVRAWPLLGRGALYMVAIFTVEYAAGAAFKRATGRVPWDYSYARASVRGYIRLDYAPAWLALGLAFERVHDLALLIEGCLRHASP